MFGAVLGVLLLGEKLMLWGWSGIAMLLTGIAMVATDPGEKVEEGTGSTDSSSPPLSDLDCAGVDLRFWYVLL
jgi:drug/metabolite transporter (DMT)-like permease